MAYIKLRNGLHCVLLRVFILVFCAFICGCKNHSITPDPGISPAYSDNVIVAFFDEAELQIETADQEQVYSSLNIVQNSDGVVIDFVSRYAFQPITNASHKYGQL